MNLPQVVTWRAGPGGELTWHWGPTRGCDVVGGHADAHEGFHVACEGFACGGHKGIVGPL